MTHRDFFQGKPYSCYIILGPNYRAPNAMNKTLTHMLLTSSKDTLDEYIELNNLHSSTLNVLDLDKVKLESKDIRDRYVGKDGHTVLNFSQNPTSHYKLFRKDLYQSKNI